MTNVVGLIIALVAGVLAAVYLPSPFGWIVALILFVCAGLAALGRL